MRCFLAALLLCLLLPIAAQARPSNSIVTPFNGDRYGAGQAVERHTVKRERVSRRLSIGAGFRREVARAVASRPAAWCGWWLGQHLGMHDRKLWLARNWASVGSGAGGPQVGAVVVWRHHVGIITGRSDKGWIVKSGNDGRAVRERVRSVAGAIAFRMVRG